MQMITGGATGNTATGAATVRYARWYGLSGTWSATIGARQVVAPTAGYFKFFRGLANGAPGAGASWTFAFDINGVASALSFSISDTGVRGGDMLRKARVTPGDLICIRCTNSNSPTARQVMCSVIFVADRLGESIILGGVGINHASPNTYYQGLAIEGVNGPTTAVDVFNNPIPKKCRLKRMYISIDVAPAGAASWTFTLRKTGAAQTVTVAITGAATTGNDTTNVDSAVVGDNWGLQIVPAGGPATFTQFRYGLVAEFDDEGYSFQCTLIWTGSATGATNYISQIGCTSVNATEAVVAPPVQVFLLSNFYVRSQQAPGVGKSYTYTLRRNTADTTVTCTISGAATSANDTTRSARYRLDDVACISITPANVPTAQSVIATNTVQYIEPNQNLLEKIGAGHGTRVPHAANQGGLMRKIRKRVR